VGEAATSAKAERRIAMKRRMILVLNRELRVQSVRSRFGKAKAKKREVAWR
jgi:hypothetical protein